MWLALLIQMKKILYYNCHIKIVYHCGAILYSVVRMFGDKQNSVRKDMRVLGVILSGKEDC